MDVAVITRSEGVAGRDRADTKELDRIYIAKYHLGDYFAWAWAPGYRPVGLGRIWKSLGSELWACAKKPRGFADSPEEVAQHLWRQFQDRGEYYPASDEGFPFPPGLTLSVSD